MVTTSSNQHSEPLNYCTYCQLKYELENIKEEINIVHDKLRTMEQDEDDNDYELYFV